MNKVSFLILGAGPAGLTFARKLKDLGIDEFLVLEKENEAGGLCRSVEVDGSPLDIGGGHFLDVRRPKVNEFLFRFMPEKEWELFERDSRIKIGKNEIGHPFEANLWQMDIDSQIEYLVSIAKAGCNQGELMPDKFVDWIRWKLGDKIADNYMLPYNRKMFADDLNDLGTYWLDKLPDVSFEETLRSCLMKKAYGMQPGHAQFYYPKEYGYGEVWLRIAASIQDHVKYEKKVIGMDFENRIVMLEDGTQYMAEHIITTIPWNAFSVLENVPVGIKDEISKLRHSAIEIRYVPRHLETNAHWIYIPDETISYHRILVRQNFCRESKGYWVETRKERCISEKEDSDFSYLNEYAYPLNTVDKCSIMNNLLVFALQNRIYGLGRWGEHNHYNSDVVVEKAMILVEELVNKGF